MRIRAFHIDGFGILSQVTVDDLPAGMGVFLGNNEAGKSTCLEFFRTVLTGYPLPRTKESKKSWAAAGPRQGGSLQLVTQNGVCLRLSRQPGPGGGTPTLYDARGNPLDVAELDQLLAGVTREVYRNIYGFSLSELQTFDSLDNDAVRNALYGAGFGLGLNTPGMAMSRLQEGMDAVFKPSGKNPPLNVALRQWDELKRELRDAEQDAARYDAVAAEMAEAMQRLAGLRQEKLNFEDERRHLERRLGVWKQWEEWRLARARLDRLETVDESFPLDGPSRLDRLLDKRENAQRVTAVVRERVTRVAASLDHLEIDPRLLTMAHDVKAMSERKVSCRNALVALPTLRANYQRMEASLARQLSSLGPEWNMRRIHEMDRSLFVREDLERRAAALQAADAGIMALTASLEHCERETEQARQAAQFARQTLDALPEPVAELEPSARDALHSQILRMEEARQRLPERQKALAASRSEYSRALSYLHLRPDTSTTLLHALADAQEQALLLADSVRTHNETAAAAAREMQSARKDEEAASDRLLRLQAQEHDLSGADRQALDNRRTVLRRLRQSNGLLQQEEERQADLNERCSIQESASPRPRVKKGTLAAGLILSLTGAAVLTARIGFGFEHLNLAPLWYSLQPGSPPPAWVTDIPLVLAVAYLILFVGVVFLAMGLPHSGPDKARSESQLQQLRSRRDASASRLGELSLEIQALCDNLGVNSHDAATLDAMESQLDREREQCATNERLQQEKALLQAELDAKRRQLHEREAEHAAAETSVRAARRRWHDYLCRLGVLTVPLPEAASAYFARVESTRLARAATAAIEDELQDLRGRGEEMVRVAREHLPQEALPKWLSPHGREFSGTSKKTPYGEEELESVMESIRRVLDSCRQADAQAEERARAAEALRSSEASALRSQESSRAAENSLREAKESRAALDEEWQDYLGELGLPPLLSPGTTREALDCMERCLAAEAELNRMAEEIAMQERERDSLAVPLVELLEQLDRKPRLGLDREPDWLGTLDIIQRDVDSARRLGEDQERIESQKTALEEELRTAEAAEADAHRAVDELLALGRATDPESFRRLAAVQDERHALLRRCQDLEDALRLAAGDIALEIFLEEFAAMEKGTLDARHSEATRRLDTIREDEQRQASTAATLSARLSELAASQRLADLRMQEAALEENVRRLSREWSRFALAKHLLVDARRHFEKERQPEVVRLASGLFSTITGGAWPLITASLEDSSLRVLPPHGDPIPPELLSRGTQEQLYLALRMAHIRSHGRRAEPLPVIMDDIMVNFDPSRTERTMEALSSLTFDTEEGPGHQILFFTCHPGTAEKLRASVPDSALYTVESGKISRAG